MMPNPDRVPLPAPSRPGPAGGAADHPGPGARAAGWLALALGLAGAALRLRQYAANASLWADEANMALNIVERPLPALLGPLDHRQVAPPGWLLLEKAAVAALGDGELALRLVPLLGSLAALPLTWHVARRALRPGIGPPLALGLVALGIPFIAYAAEVKPYATDVAVALGLVALALAVRQEGPGNGRALRLGLAGVIAPWLSYPATLVLAGLSVVLLALAAAGRDRPARRAMALVTVAGAASVAVAVAWARGTVTPDDAAYMQRFWANWFAPWPPRTLQHLGWPVARLTTVYGGGGLRYPAPGVFLALGAFGAVALWRRARPVAWLLLAPLGATFAAAALRVYPFAPRLVLFVFPLCLVLTAAGVDALGGPPGGRRRRLARLAALACGVLALVGLARHAPPYAPEPLRPVLRAMREAWRPGDRVYVYYGAEKAFRYYAPRVGLAPGDYVLGRCARDDRRAYLRELDAFRGAPRVWVVMAHATPALEEDTALLGYLDRIGRRLATHRAGAGGRERATDVARADLYDLSDPARLAAADADGFPLPPGRGGAAWSCHPGGQGP